MLAEDTERPGIKIQMTTVRRGRRIIVVTLLILIAVSLCSLSIGRFMVPLGQTVSILASSCFEMAGSFTEQMQTVIMDVRLPRIIAAIFVGGALSLAGASYQGLFRNPLVSPDLLGVSAGACVGAALAILLHLSPQFVSLFALLFGIAAVSLTVLIPHLFRNGSNLMLILSGVLVGGLMSSIIGLMKYIADPEEELASIVYWTMGSLAATRWDSLLGLLPLIIVPAIILVAFGWRINLLSLGDKEARALGVNVLATKAIVIICSTLLTSTATCISGTIGWIGLIIPHLVRLLVGENNRFLVPASFLAGAAFLVCIDTLARTLTSSEIPLSIFTGIVAVPLFVGLLIIKKPRIS